MNNVKEKIDLLYRDQIQDIILLRYRILTPIVIVLHLAFNFIDRITYPHHADFFLQIRTFDSLTVFLIFLLSFVKQCKPIMVWFIYFGSLLLVSGMSVMVYQTDGTSSRYYEGVNLVFLGMGLINSFYYKQNILFLLVEMEIYEIAMLGNKSHFNLENFSFASYFMGSTALFVALMSKFYSEQHYKAFVQKEQLKYSEEKLALLYKEADELSKTDGLTEINNRRYFFEMLHKKIEKSEIEKHNFYLIIFDVDHFKQINDAHGHSFGDDVLVQITQIVKNNIRSNDFLGRYGGDEFILCMEHINRETLISRLNKVRQDIAQLSLKNKGEVVPVSVSFGAACFMPGLGLNDKMLMEKADANLLLVKQTGRGTIKVSE